MSTSFLWPMPIYSILRLRMWKVSVIGIWWTIISILLTSMSIIWRTARMFFQITTSESRIVMENTWLRESFATTNVTRMRKGKTSWRVFDESKGCTSISGWMRFMMHTKTSKFILLNDMCEGGEEVKWRKNELSRNIWKSTWIYKWFPSCIFFLLLDLMSLKFSRLKFACFLYSCMQVHVRPNEKIKNRFLINNSW